MAPALLLPLAAGPAWATTLAQDETVMFIPGYARVMPDGRLSVRIQAWVFEFERRRGARAAFAALAGFDLDSLPEENRQIFEARSRYFLTDSERGKDLTLSFGGPSNPQIPLPPTDRSGLVEAVVEIPGAGVADIAEFQTASLVAPENVFHGLAHVVPETGLSVVSDIDDTIKISNVAQTRALLRDSLTARYKAVPGMAAAYRKLASQQGTRFHYLSSSPIQLLPALQEFMAAEGFPQGSMHLRKSTAWNTLVPSKGGSLTDKAAVLQMLLRDFPKRDFLFVGDSGEHDPEIYGEISRTHRTRRIKIAIRVVNDEPRETPRFNEAFAELDPESWRVFADGDDL